jgi:succinyl-CoA synthetase beta subunit
MKLFEYEGKLLFKKVGIKVPNGVVTSEPIKWQGRAVVKAQLLEGGRGKRGLVRITDDVYNTIVEMKKYGINKFLVEEFVPHNREFYISALLDRDTGDPMILVSKEGGIDVESAKDVRRFTIPLERGVRSFDILALEKYLEVKGLEPIVRGLYKLIVEYNAELAEINPLVETNEGLIALDSKVILDDNSLYMHQDLLKELGRETEEEESSLVELEGDIGIIGNGAGLTMATMDMVKLMGGNPADFYDVGGGASRERVKEAVIKVGSLPKVKKIIINIFGGITRCDEVAKGVVEALNIAKKPIYIRLVGTNEEEGWKILRENGIAVYQDIISCIGDALRS